MTLGTGDESYQLKLKLKILADKDPVKFIFGEKIAFCTLLPFKSDRPLKMRFKYKGIMKHKTRGPYIHSSISSQLKSL